jgi:pullulanase/glycogen debranching enzyme
LFIVYRDYKGIKMKKSIETSRGAASPLGLSFREDVWNFALFSRAAKEVWIGLFTPDSEVPFQRFVLNRDGDIWHIALKNVPPGTLYAYQCLGAWDEKTGDLFREDQWLLDPYARFPATSPLWNREPLKQIAAAIERPPLFDWQNIASPQIGKEDLVIYEMHLRGFTIHESSRVKKRGTFLGMVEKIPYLKELGITAVQLMPIFEFDECHSKNVDPDTQKKLPNYWGYNPISFFGVKRSYGRILNLKPL